MIQQLIQMFGPSHMKEIESLARQVVDSSVEGVCQRVGQRMDNMTLSEARGYIRARAASTIRRHTRLILSQQKNANPAWAASIVRTSTERIIPLVLRQLGVGVPRLATVRQAA